MSRPGYRTRLDLSREQTDYFQFCNGKLFEEVYFSDCRFEMIAPVSGACDLYYGGAWLGSCLRRSFSVDVGVQWSHLASFFRDPTPFVRCRQLSALQSSTIRLALEVLRANTDECWLTQRSTDITGVLNAWSALEIANS